MSADRLTTLAERLGISLAELQRRRVAATEATIRWLDAHTTPKPDPDPRPVDERPCADCGHTRAIMLLLGPDLRGHMYRLCGPCWRIGVEP